MKPLQFFIDNIGKVIYRDTNGCTCPTCKDVEVNGLLVEDLSHATYLFNIQNDMMYEGVKLEYRDKK